MLLTKYSIKFRIAVLVLTAFLCIAGPLCYSKLMPREGMPDVTIPYVFVTAVYEGVAPSEMENLITIPIEKRFRDLENVKKIESTSSEGVALVVIEFTPKQNIDTAVQKVKDKIDLSRPDLPRDLDQPVVQGLNLSTDIPVLRFAVSGGEDLERLNSIAEDLQDTIEAVPGVMQTKVFGAPEREIRVEVDLYRLTAYELSLTDLFGAIRGQNATVSAGNLSTGDGKFQVRVPGEFVDVIQLKEIIIKNEAGRPIRLTDVADIRDGYKDISSVSRVNGSPCVSLNVHKRSGENTDRLIRRVKESLAAVTLPPGMTLTILQDTSEDIRMMIEDLENNLVSGLLMVVAVLVCLMGLRNSILVGVAIPLSFMLGLLWLHVLGLTLNMMVLFSLVLTVGMFVDNGIVIVENVYRRHMEGESRLQAALEGTAEVAWPVTTSTLTSLAAFWPMMYWPGIMGQFMSYLPKTVIIVMTASLFVALVITPVLCSLFLTRPKKRESTDDEPHGWKRLGIAYERILRAALNHRGLCTAVGFAILFFSVAAFARWGKGVELFPTTEPRRATVEVKYPEGTDISRADSTLKTIEKQLSACKDIKYYLATVGSAAGSHLSAGEAAPHLGSIDLEFKSIGERTTNTTALVNSIRRGIGDFPGARIKVEPERQGPPGGAPISIEISGDDFEVLGELADDVMRRIQDVPGLVDLQDNMEDAKPEIQLTVDRERAAGLDLTPAQVGSFLRSAINGEEVSKFRAGEDEYDITVRLREDQRRNTDLLKQTFVDGKDGAKIPLSSLGEFVYAPGRGQITRKDQKRVVMVSGFNQERGEDKILIEIRGRLDKISLPKGYTIKYAGDKQDQEEAMAFLLQAFLIALALIALILVMEFNSILLPFNIMVSVLLSMVGVIWSLLTGYANGHFGMKFGVIMSGIAVISLAGVVVNNGIVLIDCINQRKAQGLSSTEAIITGGRLRLRPVLLTALVTVTGLVPMAFGWGLEIHEFPPRMVAGAETSAWWAPMSIAVMYGLLLATVLTLVQVPVMFSLSDSAAEWLRKRFAGKFHEKPHVS